MLVHHRPNLRSPCTIHDLLEAEVLAHDCSDIFTLLIVSESVLNVLRKSGQPRVFFVSLKLRHNETVREILLEAIYIVVDYEAVFDVSTRSLIAEEAEVLDF